MATIPRDKKQSQEKVNRCSLDVRKLPLERFMLYDDGRKQKQLARTRRGLLLELSTYANPDGSMTRGEKNFSPSVKSLIKKFAHSTLFDRLNDLSDLALLSWNRPQHYSRRVYLIEANAPYPTQEQVRYSRKNRSGIQKKQVRPVDCVPEITGPASGLKTGPASGPVPSLGSPSLNLKSYRQKIEPMHGAQTAPDLNQTFEQIFQRRRATPEPEPAPRILCLPPAPKPRRLFTDDEWFDFCYTRRSVESLPQFRHLPSIAFANVTLQIFRSIRIADPSAPVPDQQTLIAALDQIIADAKAKAEAAK